VRGLREKPPHMPAATRRAPAVTPSSRPPLCTARGVHGCPAHRGGDRAAPHPPHCPPAAAGRPP